MTIRCMFDKSETDVTRLKQKCYVFPCLLNVFLSLKIQKACFQALLFPDQRLISTLNKQQLNARLHCSDNYQPSLTTNHHPGQSHDQLHLGERYQ